VIFGGIEGSPASEAGACAVQDPCKLFYGTQMCYIFLRLHHAMYVRLRAARQLAAEAAQAQAQAMAEGVHPHDLEAEMFIGEGAGGSSSGEGAGAGAGGASTKPAPKQVYNYFMSQVLALVEGTVDNARFEEFCRSLLGNKSYVLYTLDKLIAQAVKHLQAMANDENVTKLIGLFVYHTNKQEGRHASASASGSSGAGTQGVDPVLYRNHVSCILSHTMEDVFRIQVRLFSLAAVSCGFSVVLFFLFFVFLCAANAIIFCSSFISTIAVSLVNGSVRLRDLQWLLPGGRAAPGHPGPPSAAATTGSTGRSC
jgi:histone deacetylase complex regulatory component SIN3